MSNDGNQPSLNPLAISPEDAVRVMAKVGGEPITVDMVRADLTDGAPTNTDGTLNLIHYAAWLVKEMGRGS